ncbi:MAG: glycosyltransferase family 4 protein [Ignavibacteriae bacterium]|nr:glycosyltransferase family 4 protein [Ignavibacteriota bacterium]
MIHQPLNILQTCFSPSWGGLELQALELTKQLHNRTHRTWIACPPKSRLANESRLAGVNVLELNVSGYFHPVVLAKLARFLHDEGVDIIHCHHSKDIATVVPAVKLSGEHCRIVLTKSMGSRISKKDLFHRYTYGNVDRVFAVSDVIHKNVLDTTPVAVDRVLTLHYAVDTEMFSLSRVSRDRVRREFGFTDDMLVVGFVGRFTHGKGYEEFIEAAGMLHQKFNNIRFLVVGEASYGEQTYEQRIRNMSHSLKLDGIVKFAGFRKDVPDVMASFDIFAFPSYAEAFGIVLIEAMAMERPVVSSNCDGVLDIVVDGVTGLYVNPRSATDLADALARLGANPELMEKMGKAGRRRVEEFFDQRKQLNKIEEIYYELLELPSHLKPITTAR